MMTTRTQAWLQANERWMFARIAEVTGMLTQTGPSFDGDDPCAIRAGMRQPPALEQLAEQLGLTGFEQDLLVLVAAVELSPASAAAISTALGHAHAVAPTLALALDLLPNSHWSALSPGGPLRRLRMIEIAPGPSLATSPLRIDERVLHHLIGADYLDERLAAIIRPVAETASILCSHRDISKRIAAAWAEGSSLVQVVGPHYVDRLAVIAGAAEELGVACCRVVAEDIPTAAAEREGLHRLWERETIFRPALLGIEIGDQTTAETESNAVRFAEGAPGAIVSARRPIDTQLPTLDFEVPVPATTERWQILASVLGIDPGVTPPPAVAQFALSTARLLAAGREAVATSKTNADLDAELWAACRAQARPRLEQLAQRIEPTATWSDLVVPQGIEATLREIKAHVHYQSTVYDRWGFRGKGNRGLGVTALFCGESGTGKTMAAEVLANDLSLDLYRIDLSSVVSKYIGETEKNLRKVFDAAEEGGAILLFDEADALFGKRTEVKDSHDRYANIEVSYLLQRMEAYRGLAVLTTNLRDSLDDAFLRRIRFVVRFPFPKSDDRARLWRSIWPDSTPMGELDFDRLSTLALAGGNIRSIAVDAAFRAAAAADRCGGEPIVDMESVGSSVRAEAHKIEMPLFSRDWGTAE